MGASNEKPDELAGYRSDPLEDLTIQDALIFSAVYAVQADSEKCKKIGMLAHAHPLFDEKPEDTIARVNKFTNWMQGGQSSVAFKNLLRDLKPEQRKQAFEFATQAAMLDDEVTEEKKEILRTLAVKLTLENEFVDQKLAMIGRVE